MSTTIFLDGSATHTWGGHPVTRCSDESLGRYQQILDEQRLSWTAHHRLIRLLGSGGQGVVYLTERRGTDSFTLPVALKIFSPERYESERSYDEAMARMAEVAARVALVAFLPDDLDLVKRGPAYRREFVDDLAVQLWPAAAGDQQEYERALRQRNALLRREGRRADPTTLEVWDERLAALGATVVCRRLQALGAVAGGVEALCRLMGGGGEAFAWDYLGAGIGAVGAGEAAPALQERLARAAASAREEDLERRTTTVGPHRDEVTLMAGGRDLRTRASQGEQRTVALALRLAAFDLLAERRRSAPVLVLDDVFSELDGERRARLVERLPRGQVFISSAHGEDVPAGGLRWAVEPGRVWCRGQE